MSVDVRVEPTPGGWVATVNVEQGGTATQHRVTVRRDDLKRYGATDATDLVKRSFAFLLAREPNTSILREFRITEIERYFPEYPATIRPEGRS
jgi:hypothetical protein